MFNRYIKLVISFKISLKFLNLKHSQKIFDGLIRDLIKIFEEMLKLRIFWQK
jgi:hypothetical protein